MGKAFSLKWLWNMRHGRPPCSTKGPCNITVVGQIDSPEGSVTTVCERSDNRLVLSGLCFSWLFFERKRGALKIASSEKSVGRRYAPMGAGSSARVAREPDVG